MKLNLNTRENGNSKVRYDFAFRTAADGANDPDAILDCKSSVVSSVVRTSEGLYTVTLAAGCPLKEITCAQVTVAPAAATGTLRQGWVTPGSLNVTNRTFTVTLAHLVDTTTDATMAVQDAIEDSMVNVTVCGPSSESFTDE